MLLPDEFIRHTAPLFGTVLWKAFVRAMDEEPPVSIRLNPRKPKSDELRAKVGQQGERVPWCADGYYLHSRPVFTADPLLHAGAYYVQEASSMFLDTVLRQVLPLSGKEQPQVLDLCAAPGGKSTLAVSALPAGSVLTCNEPVRKRASVLVENIAKWGYPNVEVTNSYAADFATERRMFNIIIADVPCSGEGMFRKDEDAARLWSTRNVERCARLQRQIVSDIWPCLEPGGIMIYSTCTLNTRENEENVRYIAAELGADIVPVTTQQQWGITGSLLKGFDAPVYRFIPGLTRGEGLFMAVLRKTGSGRARLESAPTRTRQESAPTAWRRALHVIYDSREAKKPPSPSLALSTDFDRAKYPTIDLGRDEALSYLRHEALHLPEGTPLGYVAVSYDGRPLGFVKNIGSRANNLYPAQWRIRSTHIHDTHEAIS